jgi:ABC-type Mn2+/Zn2+ transport system permease subunit
MAMLANSLSHTILIGIAMAFLLGAAIGDVPSLLIGAWIAAL